MALYGPKMYGPLATFTNGSLDLYSYGPLAYISEAPFGPKIGRPPGPKIQQPLWPKKETATWPTIIYGYFSLFFNGPLVHISMATLADNFNGPLAIY